MDAQWIDEFHHALRISAGGDRTGYYEDFDGISHLAKSYRDAYVYDGQFSPHRKKKFGVKAENNKGEQFVVFSQNHDHVGNRMLGERTSTLFSFEMLKLLAGAVFISPYLPMLFMGEEWGENNPFLYFIAHTDTDLVEAVRKGRKEEFAAFHLKGETPDPASVDTFEQSKLNWDLLEVEQHFKLFQFYKELIALRKKEPALHHLERKNVSVLADNNKETLLLKRWYNNQEVLCFLNFSKSIQEMKSMETTNTWQLLFDSASTLWLGPKEEQQSVYDGASIFVQPESILIYSNSNV
jgi:maltooligosyltrehalose trehalohydrolase